MASAFRSSLLIRSMAVPSELQPHRNAVGELDAEDALELDEVEEERLESDEAIVEAIDLELDLALDRQLVTNRCQARELVRVAVPVLVEERFAGRRVARLEVAAVAAEHADDEVEVRRFL